MQTRLHAVAVCDELFTRSRAFRGHVAAQFPAFLELAVGHKAARPLPGPPRLSTQLRERALDAVEGWSERHGVFYQQVAASGAAGAQHWPQIFRKLRSCKHAAECTVLGEVAAGSFPGRL